MQRFQSGMLASLLAVLAGCGGGDGSSADGQSGIDKPTAPKPVDVTAPGAAAPDADVAAAVTQPAADPAAVLPPGGPNGPGLPMGAPEGAFDRPGNPGAGVQPGQASVIPSDLFPGGETPAGFAPGGAIPGGMPPGEADSGMPGGAGLLGAIMGALAGSDIAEVSSWSDEQIEAAVRERDARAIQAIDLRIQRSPHDGQLVRLLQRLLEASVAKPTDTGNQRAGFPRAGIPGAGFPRAGNRIADEETDDDRRDDNRRRRARDQSFRTQSTAEHLTSSAFTFTRRPRDDEDEEEDEGGLGALGRARERMRGQAGAPQAGVKALPPGTTFPGGLPGGTFPPGRSSRPGGGSPLSLDDRDLLAAIVRGFVRNGSDEAWRTVMDILTESQPTALPAEESTMVVFEEVFGSRRIDEEAVEQFATKIITMSAPPKLALDLLASLSQQLVREELHLPDDKAGAAAPDIIPGGFGGFGAIGRPDRLDPDGRRDRGQRFGNQFGGRPGNRSAGRPTVKVSKSAARKTLPALRSPRFVDALQKKISSINGLAPENSSLLGLAATMPHNGIRQTLYQRFVDSYDTGADSLLDGGVYDGYLKDPGHLAVLKALLQEKTDRDAAATDPDSPMVSWRKATWQSVQDMRDRLREASEDRRLAFDGKPPIRLHRGAEPEVSIRLIIPDGSEHVPGNAANSGDDSDPEDADETVDDSDADSPDDALPPGTQIYYTRCRISPESKSARTKISDHYESRTRGTRWELADQGVVWFDGGRRSADGTRLTMDVLIEQVKAAGGAAPAFGVRAEPRGGGAAGQTTSYTVEAITVIVNDPAASRE